MPELETQTTGALMGGFVVMAALLGLVALGGIAIDRILEPNDPKRALARQILIYGGTALFIVILLLLR